MIIPGHLRLRASGVLIHEEGFGEVGVELRPVEAVLGGNAADLMLAALDAADICAREVYYYAN